MPPKFLVRVTQTSFGSQHYHLTILAKSVFGETHPGWVLIRRDTAVEHGLLEEGSGIFRPEFVKEIRRLLEAREPESTKGEH